VISGLVTACFVLAAAVIGCFIVAYIINALAPTFGATKNNDLAFKVAAYSYTPAWVAGVLQILPPLAPLFVTLSAVKSEPAIISAGLVSGTSTWPY
jgi:hypothetical protein